MIKNIKHYKKLFYLLLIQFSIISTPLYAQQGLDNEFTYQGQLEFNNGNANGLYDFEFNFYDDALDGSGTFIDTFFADDVNVTSGLFTTAINIANPVFIGQKVWVEINVREGASIGAFEKLLPRQAITSAPYAIHAQFVGADAISSAEIQDGTIEANDILANSIGSGQVQAAEIQQRISFECTAGDYMTGVNEDGTVNCATDQMGGGITTVTTTEIVDGTIETIDMADNSITSNKIAANAVGSSEINSAEVQRRVGSTCLNDFYLSGINADGSVICRQLPIAIESEAIPAILSSIGSDSAVAIRPATGLPIISFYNITFGNLEIYNCSNTACSAGNFRTLDSTGIVGAYTSITIKSSDGFALISYYDESNERLKVYSCSNHDCTSGTATVLDEAGDVGKFTSIAMRSNGFAVISYFDTINSDLNYYSCGNSNCTSGSAYALDSTNSVGAFSSIAVKQDDNVIISYYDIGNGDLKVFNCTSADCTSGTINTLDSTGDTGQYTSIVYSDGEAFISYYDVTNGDLKVYDCYDESCSTGASISLDSGDNAGQYSSMVLKPDGTPIISYAVTKQALRLNLKIYSCYNNNCTNGGKIKYVGGTNSDEGFNTNIAIKADGNPIVSYGKGFTNTSLKIYSCGDPDCQK